MSKNEQRTQRILDAVQSEAKWGGRNLEALVRAIVREVFAEEAAKAPVEIKVQVPMTGPSNIPLAPPVQITASNSTAPVVLPQKSKRSRKK